MKTYEKDKYFTGGLGLSVMPHKKTCKDEPQHTHEFIEIVYIASGSGVHGIDGVEYSVSRGSLLFINYRQVHYFRGDMEYVNVLLEPRWISEKLIDTENAFELLSLSAFNDFQALDSEKPLVCFKGAERARLERLLELMQKEYSERAAGCDTVLKSQISILLTLIFRKMLPKVESIDTMQYIREHLDRRITLSELASESFYNPSYFSRMFRDVYGMTVTEYINRARIDKAKALLESTSLTAQEISEQVGFASKTAFYKRFSESTGLTPRQYRESKK